MKYNKKLIIGIVILFVLSVGVFSYKSLKEPEEITIKFGDVRGVPTIAQHIAKDQGYYEEAGIKLEHFYIEPAHAHAAVTGDVDVALVSPTALAMAVQAGAPIKAIGLIAYGEPWRNAGVIVAKGDSGIKTVEDLRGKRIAVSYPGDVDHIYLLEVLRKFHIEDEVDIAFMLWPMHVGALVNGDVDAVQMIPYYTAVMDIEGVDYVMLDKPEGISPRKYVAVLIASTSTIETRGEDLKRFLDVHYKTQAFLQENSEKHAEYLVKYAGYKPEVANLLAEKRELISLSPDGRFDKETMGKLIKLMVDFDFLKEEMPLEKMTTEELLPSK